MPLTAYEEWTVFKLFLVDVGLLGALAQLSSHAIIEGNRIFEAFKGALAEQFIRQQLSSEGVFIGYWTNENSSAEVDFLVQKGNKIIAIEVKSGENVRSKSFSEFYKKYQLEAIRFSALPYQQQDWMQNIPLYAVGSLFRDLIPLKMHKRLIISLIIKRSAVLYPSVFQPKKASIGHSEV